MWEVLLYELVGASLSLNHTNPNGLIIVNIFTKQAEITKSNGCYYPYVVLIVSRWQPFV